MKDPAFLFYPGDYLRDTQCLSEIVQVAYDRIMCEHMRNICISKSQLKFFTKRLNAEELAELMMVLTEIEGGYQITWVAESINARRAYSESRRLNRSSKKDKDVSNISPTYVQHMENENENENVIEVKNRKRIVKEKPINPFSDSFIQVWEQWKDYKKTSHRFSYKTIDSENIALAQLAKTSQGNEELAIEMIHHSIAQGYKGIFAPDKSKQQTNGTKIQLTSKFEQWLNKD